MKVYNTLTGKKEELVPLNPPEIKIYVCGPTTYNYIHLGNARPVVVFDTIRRYLKFRGYEVTYVQNFTDVDDKIINKAKQEKQDPMGLAQKFIDEYFKDADRLNVIRADVHPKVSMHIPDIIAAIMILLDKGFAYEVDGDVYFRVKAYRDYGKLSKRSLEDMLAGARIEVDERKEEAVDFALWKAAKEGEPSWDSPWGKGRPGWHIECSVMSVKYLGETFDIHGGGADLIFPHHENEIAQAEAFTGQKFVNYWIHNGFITVNSEKMSKSLGNFFILRDILEKYPADVIRFYLVNTHYRSPLDFDDSKLEEAQKALGRLKTTLVLAGEFENTETEPEEYAGEPLALQQELARLKNNFTEAMDDDFNTAKAIGILFEMSHQINGYIANADKNNPIDQNIIQASRDIFFKLGDVLGIFIEQNAEEKMEIRGILDIFAELRTKTRREKNFVIADQIRDQLKELRITVEDTAEGCRLRYDETPDGALLIGKLVELRSLLKQNKQFDQADYIRNSLADWAIILEDTKEGTRWKFADR